jgi:hypothetical protein
MHVRPHTHQKTNKQQQPPTHVQTLVHTVSYSFAREAEMPTSFADEEQSWHGILQPSTGIHVGALKAVREQLRKQQQEHTNVEEEASNAEEEQLSEDAHVEL